MIVKAKAKPRTVLVIDDEPTILRMTTRLLLSELPIRVLAAYDAESALDMAASDPPDLVVSDVRLPGIDGIELAQRLKIERPALPVVLMSAYEEPRFHHGDAFVPKPFYSDELVETVKRCLEEQ